MDDQFITMIGALGSVCNGGSRILAGWLMDNYPFKRVYLALLLIQLVVCCTITTVVQSNKYLYLIWVMIGYNCLGPHFVLFPANMVKTFGIKAGSQIYSICYIGIGVG